MVLRGTVVEEEHRTESKSELRGTLASVAASQVVQGCQYEDAYPASRCRSRQVEHPKERVLSMAWARPARALSMDREEGAKSVSQEVQVLVEERRLEESMRYEVAGIPGSCSGSWG